MSTQKEVKAVWKILGFLVLGDKTPSPLHPLCPIFLLFLLFSSLLLSFSVSAWPCRNVRQCTANEFAALRPQTALYGSDRQQGKTEAESLWMVEREVVRHGNKWAGWKGWQVEEGEVELKHRGKNQEVWSWWQTARGRVGKPARMCKEHREGKKRMRQREGGHQRSVSSACISSAPFEKFRWEYTRRAEWNASEQYVKLTSGETSLEEERRYLHDAPAARCHLRCNNSHSSICLHFAVRYEKPRRRSYSGEQRRWHWL